jgi:hypothetical protein
MTRCSTGKIRYRDRIGALFALAQMRRQDKPHRAKLERRVYRCRSCAGWHLTARR